MESNSEGNLLEIMDLARTLRQEHLFIQQEQANFANLTEQLAENSAAITKLAYICAQQRQNLNDLILSRPEIGPLVCCRRASIYENAKFVDAKNALDYEHAIAYEEFFNYLYRSPYLLALSLATGDRVTDITQQHLNVVIHTISTALFGNAINSKDVEALLKLLRELIEIQLVVNENPRRLLRPNASAFARLYHRLNESMFSAKIFLTAALFDPIMAVLSDSDTILDVDPNKVVQSLSSKEHLKLFGQNSAPAYQENVAKFYADTINKLYLLATKFIDSLSNNWSLFPSTLRWLLQTMCHQLKQVHFSEKIVNEVITDMIFTHFICPAIVSPDIVGIIDAPISESVRFNLIQIGQIIQMLALAKYDAVEAKFEQIYAKFEANRVTQLVDLLLISQTGEDVVAVVSQSSDFDRKHMLITKSELSCLLEFFRLLLRHEDFVVSAEERQKLHKILARLPDSQEACQRFLNGSNYTTYDETANVKNGSHEVHAKERSKQALIKMGKATRSKIAKSMSFNQGSQYAESAAQLANGMQQLLLNTDGISNGSGASSTVNSAQSSPSHFPRNIELSEQEKILIFNIYNGDDSKLQPLTEEEVLKMNSIGTEIANGVEETDDCNLENEADKSSATNGFDEVLRPLHGKSIHHARFSLSHDDASLGNSDNLEVVSEAPSNHSVTSSLELEENQLDQNDNLSDMVSANVSGRGTPNISGRDTPSSQVTDGESVTNALPTPQMQKLLSKARSDIEDKFCKFELKKFEGDETVSIISDTWSTDVLASDSETVDNGERDRDRNFSTPLIPSAVVLPGDNNFDPVRNSGYVDASDQRSESNWSTDVLASDSEKLAEVDTDDNLSLTARLDAVDGGARSRNSLETESLYGSNRRQRAHHHQLPSPSQRNIRGNASNSHKEPRSGHISSGSSGGNASDRSQEDSAFYDAINIYEEAGAAAAAAGNGSNRNSNIAVLNAYEELSSLARSSVRTSNQYTGENSFQQNYKSGSNTAGSKEAFLETEGLRMRRQMSAESSISSQSVNSEAHFKTRQVVEVKDLIDFSDFVDDINDNANVSPKKHNREDVYVDDNHVEHRGISFEQRSAVFDGRRNGVMGMGLISTESGREKSSQRSAHRRHQSLNYENHEIMLNSIRTAARPHTMMPNLKNCTTDDEKSQQKQQQQQQQQQEEESKLNGDCVVKDVEPTEAKNETSVLKVPNKSTGAIPKSISFDASADKSSASHMRVLPRGVRLAAGFSGEHGHHSGIFNKLKQGIFKHRRTNKSPNNRQQEDEFGTGTGLRSVSFSDANANSMDVVNEDILAKYRRKASSSSDATNSDSVNGLAAHIPHMAMDININGLNNKQNDTLNFKNVKRKIRTVLSKTELHTADFRPTTYSNASPLLTYLQIQQAQAVNVQNLKQMSDVAEAIRCISNMQQTEQLQLLTELQHDIQKRQSYLQYLMRFRQNLLLIMENFERLEFRLRTESVNCNRHLMAVCVRLFLEKQQQRLEDFQKEFSDITVSDDKILLIEDFINNLMAELLSSGGLLHRTPEWQVEEARIAIERVLLQRMYHQVMFPNDDADLSRDSFLSVHICKLQRVIHPSHPALCIPQEYLSEAPWSFAQQQLSYISAYKTPREKLQCVIKCISSIMSLLQMSSSSKPAADDLLPVLIYVVIMANPPYLLSTIEYITYFMRDKLSGEEQFYWTHFGSVVTFIKTMDYLN